MDLSVFRLRVRRLLDERNMALYKLVRKDFKVKYRFVKDVEYGVYRKNKSAIFHITKGVYSPASFAHELLHVKFDLEGIHVGGCLKCLVCESKIKDFMTEDLCDAICNALEHAKMYPIFIGMGYEGDTFLSDSRKPVMTEDLVDKLGVIREKSYIRFIDCFIGNYLYTIASPYDFFDYTDLVERMRRMEPELAAIIDDMFNRWREYDIENEKNILAISYNDIIGDFVRNLESWYN